MMIPNPDEAREISKMQEKIMGNLPEEMKRPSKNGLSLDPEIREIDATKQWK